MSVSNSTEITLAAIINYVADKGSIVRPMMVINKDSVSEHDKEIQERVILLPITTTEDLRIWQEHLAYDDSDEIELLVCTENTNNIYSIGVTRNGTLTKVHSVEPNGVKTMMYKFKPKTDHNMHVQHGVALRASYERIKKHITKLVLRKHSLPTK